MATLAGNKPRIIITVEKLIWNTIFAVARGNIDLLKALENLADSFPWLEVEAESQNDWVRYWFDGITDCEVATAGVSGQIHSETGSTTEISATAEDRGAEEGDTANDVESLDGVDDDLHHEMDVDLTDTIPPATDGLRGSSLVIEANQGSHDHDQVSPLFTPECTPAVSPGQPLFLPDSDDENLIHLVRRAAFSEDLISTDYHAYDNHYERHIIRTVIWVSGHGVHRGGEMLKVDQIL